MCLRVFFVVQWVALRCRCFVDLSTKCYSFGSSLPPFLVSTLPHALGSETKLWERGFLLLLLADLVVEVARVDSSTRLSWMLLQCLTAQASTGPETLGRGVETTRTLTHKCYRTPLQQDGGNERSLGRKSQTAFSVLCSQNRNVQPPSYHSGHP